MQGVWDKISPYVIQYGVPFVTAILIFVIGKWAAKLLSRVVEKTLEKAKVHKTLASFTKNIVYYVILIFVAIAALNKVGIETNSFVALVGAAGLAVGFALQGSLANFAAGVMIILFQPFEVGDTIEAGGAIGVVEEIQMFNTILSASDNKRVIIPNAKITSDKVVVHQKSKT
ncbi:MAG: mechanosensitive ion channel [Candidatus Omnitrophica bacterium]|nr:mechanosensitive ion channel [Candidatus Omnitrophota bacterium]